jgi:1-acyl-sn-glycerol-3-phosphate acyltransferase
MNNLTTRTALAALLTGFGIIQAAAGHPVIDGIIDYGVGKAIEKHQDAGKRLGYPPLMPPIPGPVSPHYRQMIEQIEREKFNRELQRNPQLIEQLERRGRTG